MKAKRFIAGIVAAGALAVAVPASAAAGGGGFGPGGAPENHPGGPYTGQAWGAAVSGVAPGGAISCHFFTNSGAPVCDE